MFNYIKIHKFKGLKECYLNNLGKICVLCGKNNSGKTTILEGINDDKLFSYGIQINKEIIEKFVNNTKGGMPFRGRTSEERTYKEEVNKLLSSKKVWFSNQSAFFVEKLNPILKKEFGNYQFPIALFQKHFNNFFNKQKSSILLPPKRHIERKTTIETYQEIKPDGKGVLNCLFNWKNKSVYSEKNRIYNKLLNAFIEVTNGYKFDVVTVEGENGGENIISLQFIDNGNNYRFADDCGLGLQDILVILYFSLNPEYNLVLIEEPESHIHPEMQRRLLNQFKNNIFTNKQFILSTHSNIFLDPKYIDNIYFIYFEDSVKITNAMSRAIVLDRLGFSVSDNLVSDLIILIEGPKDKPVVEEFLSKMGLLNKYDIKTWPLGGDNMGQVDLTVFAENYKVVALIDNDPGSESARRRFVEKCKELGIHCTRLKKYSLENYFSTRALREIFKEQFSNNIKTIDPDKKLEDQIGINVKNNNHKISRQMTLEEIEGTDFFNFLLTIKELCEKE